MRTSESCAGLHVLAIRAVSVSYALQTRACVCLCVGMFCVSANINALTSYHFFASHESCSRPFHGLPHSMISYEVCMYGRHYFKSMRNRIVFRQYFNTDYDMFFSNTSRTILHTFGL